MDDSKLPQRVRSLRTFFEKENRPVLLCMLLFVAAVYVLFKDYSESLAGYVASFPALATIVITSLARVNDICHTKVGMAWHLRRLGFVLAGAAAFTVLASPLSLTPRYPTWTGVMMFWGVALAWLTTPGLPPWSRYAFGNEKDRTIY